MAAAAIARNRYRLPYLPGTSVLRSSIPGYTVYKRSPGGVILGAVQTYNVSAHPADLSTFIVNAPNGQSLTFQFVFAGSTPTPGLTTVPLVAGGGTAAQTQTALLAALAASGLPLSTTAVTATHFEIDWRINGTAVAAGGTQVTITILSTTAPIPGSTQVLPGRAGRIYTLLPGF